MGVSWIGKSNNELIKVFYFNETGRCRVKLRPNVHKFQKLIILNRKLEMVSLPQECIDNDRDEKVDEDLEENVETNEKGVGV